ncbi:MAG: phosphoribosylaminoimidazole carboxylase ATPase subunit, 5-(carboxyamino)imidazole ribonucleotide synthase [Candidatus Peregrinibacteria bacterium GW2011_GWF2_33_10]|nr:MAG: phosphoribosylaminoimidazole carboxylase ATPase subunit, 5-(carboxyamino)imidazole ribonucleotide synthase [Candidatus Peregrinibacteria bacterium GW2011_GWF2_33_10]OGJ44187.1 MAG: 5-(carboxyamino)imidazole ribonucleotide synthase [Candidatus Peregrinibacteria bacterium RIFOXYA2_FULL_33_21]OGJ46671.1 MAG: 5-(carboxyamino)imidazole ribonucleotide synthase [Candidatus Peregrinibacteria bacterium RIFOXYA12_FULL_33_12]OGJ51816.1 MAG: 5-(carboxyamino)imidazole ribonucleotide synthase [Candida
MITPGACIGILGGGQLGRMLAFEAKRMGYFVIVLDPTLDCPAAQVCDQQIVAEYDDLNAALDLVSKCNVITYEFENVEVTIVEELEKNIGVYPGSKVLRTTQHRFLEKSFFKDSRILVTDFALVQNLNDLKQAAIKIGFPGILKTCRFGYDGKGQRVLKNLKDAENAFNEFKDQDLIWEKMVDFDKECSVIASRNLSGEIVIYPISENIHKDNILDISIVPARISEKSKQQAIQAVKTIAEDLEIVGTFCVEFFVLRNGEVMANEIAPRPHNSGHYSIEACYTSQFENQLRAVCNLPLGSPDLIMPAVMVNILGDGQGNTFSGAEDLLKAKGVYLHLYGKAVAKAQRKMGHITVLDQSVDQALEKALNLRQQINWI